MPDQSKSDPTYGLKEFYLEDLPRTLFPLSTNKILVERGMDQLIEFGRRLVVEGKSFLPQRRVYANKDQLHLRRTVKLDPVAEIFFYDLIYRNRSRFRKPFSDKRMHFGYRFENGRPLSPSRSYADFKAEVSKSNIFTEEMIYFDISSYFNNVYHHDLHAWFAALEPDNKDDVATFGKFLREINAGRSLDCLPQGIYPSKMVGNDFLRFIESSCAVRAPEVMRFMDDVYLFGDDLNSLKADFREIQRILGLKGLSVNDKKTTIGGEPPTGRAEESISDLKKQLLQRRRNIIISQYNDDEKLDAIDPSLNDAEIEYIVSLLANDSLGEDDAELIMIVMRDHAERLEPHLKRFVVGFPHLAKNFFGLCREVPNKNSVAEVLLGVVQNDHHLSEYQLFWFGMMLEDYLMQTTFASNIIISLFKHPNASDITRAKILEIGDHRYGLPEMREAYLREGRSDWLAWASAVGSRNMDKQARNYLLGYFANGSDTNRLIADIIQIS